MDGAQYQEPPIGTWVDPNLCTTYSDTTQSCISEDVANDCQRLSEAGCIELIVAESCPVQLSCAKTVCPAKEPRPQAPCMANGLNCVLNTYTCPGTSTPITTKWAECFEGEWRVGMAGIFCPDPESAVNGRLVAVSAIGGSAALLLVVLLLHHKRRARQKHGQKMPAVSVDANKA